jgi:mRNA-degrading endonuclease toxin of MazEF toxin-antitoxin module
MTLKRFQKTLKQLIYQIRTLDKRRLTKEIGKIEDQELQEAIIDALCFQLGIIR